MRARPLLLDQQAVCKVIEFVKLGARLEVIWAILPDFKFGDVKNLVRQYTSIAQVSTAKGPLPTDDARNSLSTVSRRIHLSAALALYDRCIHNGVGEADALLIGFRAYARVAQMSHQGEQITFERFYILARALVENRLKLQICGECSSQYVVSEAPDVSRACPFCAAAKRRLHAFKPAMAQQESEIGRKKPNVQYQGAEGGQATSRSPAPKAPGRVRANG